MSGTGMDPAYFNTRAKEPAALDADGLFASVGTPLPPPPPPPAEEPSIDERFAKFHAANPGVYEAIERRALALVAEGATRIGVGAIYEYLRGEIRTEGEPYQLNNIFRSRYARMLIEKNPTTLGAVIETRGLTSK